MVILVQQREEEMSKYIYIELTTECVQPWTRPCEY